MRISREPDSNRRPKDLQSSTLPTELSRVDILLNVILYIILKRIKID